MQLAVFMLQEAKVIKNACMALASIVEARGVLMTANCVMSSNLYMTRFVDLQQCAFYTRSAICSLRFTLTEI